MPGTCARISGRVCAGERAISSAVMTVADDGKGLNGYSGAGRSPLASGGGNGLPNMQRRAQSMGGSAEFGARPGGGCQITVRLPVRKRVFRDAVL